MSKYYNHEVVQVYSWHGHLEWRTCVEVKEVDGVLRKIPKLRGNEEVTWSPNEEYGRIKLK